MSATVADTLIEGRIWCGRRADGSPHWAEAMVVRGDRIAAIGSRAAVRDLAGPQTRRIRLGDRVAVPAFNDAHQHLLPLGLGMKHVNLRPEQVRTLDELLSRIRAAAAATPKGGWVLARGYDHFELDVGRHPTVDELTAAAPDHPVLVRRTCGHMAVANAAALAIGEVGHNTPDPEGGVIERRAGRLTGLLQERAMRLVYDHVPEPSDAELVDAIERAGRHMTGLGYTAVMDANVGALAGMREIEAYRRALATGRLPVRTWICLAGNPEGVAEAAWEAGIRPDDGCDMLRFGAMKVFGDGSAGGLTAAMHEPYLQGGTGVFCFPDATMHGLLDRYHRQGWQLAIHAIGDAAIEQVLAGMEAADTTAQPVAGRRHRIEHCGFVTPGQMARMAARGIEPVPQPVFMYEFGDLYVTNVGPERAAAAYPMRSWLLAGQHPAASSDAPVSSTDPFQNLYTMVTRRTNKGNVVGGEEAITLDQALHCLTWCGAYTQFAENRRGRLLPGYLADVTVLSKNIFAAGINTIRDTQADLVLRGGMVVHDRLGETA
ncbi:MAG: amidohydrolase [Janthinobacterium lividum]